MNKTIRAKFTCWPGGIEKSGNAEKVKLHAVCSDSPENKQWSDATPSGTLEMYISNPGAHGLIEEGKEYFIDITPAP